VRRSGVAQHTLENDHQIGWKKSVVIGQEKSFYKRRLKEALHIRKFPNFNQNLDLDIILA